MTFPGTGVRVWLISRYEDIQKILSDSRGFSSDSASATDDFRTAGLAIGPGTAWENAPAFSDPPDHTRIRRLLSPAFAARRVATLAGTLQKNFDQILNSLPSSDESELLGSIAYPFSIATIADILGAPLEDHEELQRLASEAVHPDRTRSLAAIGLLLDRARAFVAERRAHPRDDLLSDLIRSEEAEETLTEAELVGTVGVLVVAGYNTTANLIGNGILALLDHEDQLRLLQDRPSLIGSAIEEILRYESPAATSLWRFPRTEVTIGTTGIPAGEPVLLLLGSANRDPSAFADADSFLITRPSGPHLAFGHGIHFCLGAPLARLAGQTAISSLITKFPDIRLADPRDGLRYRPALIDRALVELPVRLGPARVAPACGARAGQ
ncbi:cytochrome P450 [Microbispora sp. NEAU-D428]|uniref:cytochrome P450 n=1 Tax=Microbispora sitophila TaxID=2771537 RepID=UPI0018677282|nr:cytochrome P450 [Microbispora sitophila]MBE3014806.1 cytochrome P450 [Microbispora sitophila]